MQKFLVRLSNKHTTELSLWTQITKKTVIIMNKIKCIISGILIIGLFSMSGCFVTKAGNYVSEKTKAGWSATKSFFGADEE